MSLLGKIGYWLGQVSKYYAIFLEIRKVQGLAKEPQVIPDGNGGTILAPARGADKVLDDIQVGLVEVEKAYESAVDIYEGASTVFKNVQGYL